MTHHSEETKEIYMSLVDDNTGKSYAIKISLKVEINKDCCNVFIDQ